MARAGGPRCGGAGPDLDAADEQERLEQALRRLPDHQRVPIVLFHFENKSYLEIAALLGVTLAKVKTDIHRGREALKTCWYHSSCRPMISKIVVDRALKQLPGPRAPRTLLPRVMAAVEGEQHARQRQSGPPRARPWARLAARLAGRVGRRADRTRVGSRPAVAARRIGDGAGRPNAGREMRCHDQRVAADVVSTAATVASVTRIVWHALVQPLVGYAAGADSRDVCGVRHVRRGAGPSRPRRSSADMKSISLRLAAGVAAVVLVAGSADRARAGRARSALRANVV